MNLSGVNTVEYPGDSSRELCAKHNRRMSKVSCTMLINAGLVEPKRAHNLCISMENTVNIL